MKLFSLFFEKYIFVQTNFGNYHSTSTTNISCIPHHKLFKPIAIDRDETAKQYFLKLACANKVFHLHNLRQYPSSYSVISTMSPLLVSLLKSPLNAYTTNNPTMSTHFTTIYRCPKFADLPPWEF